VKIGCLTFTKENHSLPTVIHLSWFLVNGLFKSFTGKINTINRKKHSWILGQLKMAEIISILMLYY
jgi:hypothetical protein